MSTLSHTASLDSSDVTIVLQYFEVFLLLLCSLTTSLLRYTQNGILHMLDRNKRIKSKPERFQCCKDKFDLVITCEERVYDQVLEGEAFQNKCLKVAFFVCTGRVSNMLFLLLLMHFWLYVFV